MYDPMNGREIDFIPDRLIQEPVVFRGMTDSEVVSLAGIGIAFWIPASVILLLPFGLGLFGVGVGFGMAIVTLLVLGQRLQPLKRRLPDGLHIPYLKKLAQQKLSFVDFGYIDRTGPWDIRRTQEITKQVFEDEFDV